MKSSRPWIPFCVNPYCSNHTHPPPDSSWYSPHGFYFTKAFKEVSRFRCKLCGSTFSTQTFSIDYYAKRLIDYRRLFALLVSCTSVRDIQRYFSCSTGTVWNKSFRLARQLAALHGRLFSRISTGEPFVIDGFENFVVSQFFPNNINLLVGKNSQFLYDLSYSALRRKGRMTESQKNIREHLDRIWPIDKRTIEKGVVPLMQTMFRRCRSKFPLILHSDKHGAYTRALYQTPYIKELKREGFLIHVRTSSRKARTVKNPLFSVNYLDRELRKQLKECVRETTCCGRNVNNVVERMIIYRGYYNYRKAYRHTQQDLTHGEVAGIEKAEISRSFRFIFSRREFFSKVKDQLLPNDVLVWSRSLSTPLKWKKEYIPQYAFM